MNLYFDPKSSVKTGPNQNSTMNQTTVKTPTKTPGQTEGEPPETLNQNGATQQTNWDLMSQKTVFTDCDSWMIHIST